MSTSLAIFRAPWCTEFPAGMTTWSVVKDDTREKRWRELLPRFFPRIALLACITVVVISLGVALTPGSPKASADQPFSEQARAAALSETLRLRAAGEQLVTPAAGAAPTGSQAPIAQTVNLLTDQARALLGPGDEPAAEPLPASSPATPSAAAQPGPASAAELAAALAASGSERLAEAAAADGGIARLLAAVGAAQLLEASSLAVATGSPAPAAADPASPALSGACRTPAATSLPAAAGTDGAADAEDASLEGALAAAVRTELETIYGYQVALTRLGGEQSSAAAKQLARHESLISGAETLSRAHCVPVPPREAGYTLEQSFLASPASGLGRLEAAALPVYGDLVALSDGETRQWAISGLVGAARRAELWGADAGSLPGLAADPASFPSLPTPSASPSTTR
ncbi:ferritin-like domain-containing protein [Arthrobacter sp. UYCu712]|uniref:ferritin-like domain-containing protein n=1 Tax=Arthrobacter sp. UYCu712 TaxID=3156340 RepID=UPI0033988990